MAPFNFCVFFLLLFSVYSKKNHGLLEYFPGNLEENVNVKMVFIVAKARFAMTIGLSIMHYFVLKVWPKKLHIRSHEISPNANFA